MSSIPKVEIAEQLLKQGNLQVHLIPTTPGVVVPPEWASQSSMMIEVGLNMPIPIRDLWVDIMAISGTLSFRGYPFKCFIPWKAVYALTTPDGRGVMWHDDAPAPPPPPAPKRKRKLPSYLRVVK